MPGIMILELMAQVGGVLAFKTLPDREKKLVFLVGIENARFRKPVRPGDQLQVEMVVTRAGKRIGKLSGKAFVDQKIVAQADIMFSIVDRPETENS